MRIPRDLDGRELIAALGKLGYEVTRQSGSHIRLTTSRNGVHHITIPEHRPLKVGTLSAILRDVAVHHSLSRDALMASLFSKT
ncbi:MAG: type II toxin-antitoxin system HicA family toxin [Flavobacteriales bacterium]|jgi:predicted RNA binding protein YcfA (HicA-like mRNA interferase family)|nr:type II toxin-antitoxin system HicA family toxin [Flavobacteriales bacterium]MBK6892094.1 type II toxin-antitoxin system HicA family toxin [Flavobacteriales bacterium]MBK7246229.1 type II toxin-antitoxin system HicA family toxin [Flavobacteriales bacterium]MBK7286196.1 type II toxin-antitoxin system HicA family toxin [Flavobacteriales bacterium]MBK9060005.1 type II toxin-antitoxin system HicA family toxin [Flavobacteriales bacterium]